MGRVILYKQERDGFCGPAALRIILSFYEVYKSEKELGKLCRCTKSGTSAENIIGAANDLGFKAYYKDGCSWQSLRKEVRKHPVIISWFSDGGHYSVAFDVNANDLILADPEHSVLRKMKRKEFMPLWFDYKGDYPRSQSDFVLRRVIVVESPKKSIIDYQSDQD